MPFEGIALIEAGSSTADDVLGGTRDQAHGLLNFRPGPGAGDRARQPRGRLSSADH